MTKSCNVTKIPSGKEELSELQNARLLNYFLLSPNIGSVEDYLTERTLAQQRSTSKGSKIDTIHSSSQRNINNRSNRTHGNSARNFPAFSNPRTMQDQCKNLLVFKWELVLRTWRGCWPIQYRNLSCI